MSASNSCLGYGLKLRSDMEEKLRLVFLHFSLQICEN